MNKINLCLDFISLIMFIKRFICIKIQSNQQYFFYVDLCSHRALHSLNMDIRCSNLLIHRVCIAKLPSVSRKTSAVPGNGTLNDV